MLTLATSPGPLSEAATLMVVGMTVVFVSLLLLLGLVVLLNRFVGPEPQTPTPPASVHPGGLSPQRVAVIAAAATAALNPPVQINQIKVRP